MRISDWSSDVCSSDLDDAVALGDDLDDLGEGRLVFGSQNAQVGRLIFAKLHVEDDVQRHQVVLQARQLVEHQLDLFLVVLHQETGGVELRHHERSEEHTSELQSLMRISNAVFSLKKKNT